MSRISLQNIYKSYQKNNMVIKDLSLEIFENEFLVLVGPSGCGKTTTLRMIAGLEEVTKGDFFINEVRQNDKDPSSRNLSFVFQNYALFPHMTVYQNIEFGLLNQKQNKLNKHLAVEKIAKKLSLIDKLGYYPSQLSGGQRQRVALARALVGGENLVLFDEPLSNLDAVLRAEMRTELIRFQNEYEVTAIYVTHDQVEAITMASRIVLQIDGKVVQVGTPEQMYYNPNHLDVACFIGTPEINVLKGNFDGKRFISNGRTYIINKDMMALLQKHIDEEIYYTIRPQNVIVSNDPNSEQIGRVEVVEYFGHEKLLHINLEGTMIKAVVSSNFVCENNVALDFSKEAFIFDKNKRRISNKRASSIFFELRDKSPADEQIIRELKNYGYKIEDKIQSSDSYKIIQKDDYYEIIGLGKISSLQELLKYFSDIR